MDIRAKQSSVNNHLQWKTEIEISFSLTPCLTKTLRLTLKNSFLELVQKNLSKNLWFRKIFNLCTLKLSHNSFKTRFNINARWFRHKWYSTYIELAKHNRELNNNKFQYEIKWTIAVDAWSWKCGSRCELCDKILSYCWINNQY